MASYERSYGSARAVFTFLEAIGGLVTVIGIVVLTTGIFGLSSVSKVSALGRISIGLMLSLGGVISVAFVQAGRASVDQAEMTRDMLGLMRQWDMNTIGVRREASQSEIRQEASPRVRSAAVGTVIKEYRGYQLVKHNDGVSVTGNVFKHVSDAEEFIDGFNQRR